MRARDVMTTTVVTVTEKTPVEDIARILLEHRISAVPVVGDDDAVVGIVSEGDLMRRSESATESSGSWWLFLLASPEERARTYIKMHGRRAKDVMSRPVISVEEDTPIRKVADILERRGIKRVPVLREGKAVGIVSRANLLHALATTGPRDALTSDDQTIRAAILEGLREEAGVQDQFINAIVTDGTVHLWGIAQSEAESDAARLVAENTIGVRAVDNHLNVMPQNVRAALGA